MKLFLIALMLLAGAPAGAEESRIGFDAPLADQTVALKTNPPRKATLRCVRYARFMVKERHLDDDIGSAGISVVPIQAAPPACRPAREAGERTLPDKDDQWMSFLAASGRFILLYWPDGANGGTTFSVYDATTSRKLLTDIMADTDDGLHRVTPSKEGDSVELRFRRIAAGPCSLVNGDAGCWAKFAKDVRLPTPLATGPAPTALCAAAYAKQNMTTREERDDPSVLGYDVTLTLTIAGKATITETGPLSCGPAE